MKVRCIKNTGEALRAFEYKELEESHLGRFGASGQTIYGGITIGEEYLVMGVITFQTYQAYLLDDGGLISACPCQLFELIDNTVSPNWHFRLVEKDEGIYPFIQSIFGYHELCSDKKAYENLIVEKEEDTQRIYFRRKMEMGKELTALRHVPQGMSKLDKMGFPIQF